MKILIIGGSRFVGPLLIQKLLSKKHNIAVFNRAIMQSNYPNVKFIQGDRNDGFDIQDNFEVVIDMCAYTGGQTKNAIEELNFDFFINFGTAASYKKTDKFPLTEESELGEWPLWGDYNKGKVQCERVLEKSGIKYATIRPVYVLGPKNYVNREHFIYAKIKQGIPLVLPGDGKAKIQFVFAKEVADILELLAEKKISGAFNCAGDDIVTLRKVVEEMGKIVGIKPRIEFNIEADGEKFKEEEFPFANESFFVSNEKIKNLGIRFMPLIKGLRDGYQNYYKNVI